MSLHRGMTVADSTAGLAVEATALPGVDAAQVILQPMSSFSSQYAQASQFGNQMFTARIPVERIMGSARTGFGCLNEYEFIVLDGPGTMLKGLKFAASKGQRWWATFEETATASGYDPAAAFNVSRGI